MVLEGINVMFWKKILLFSAKVIVYGHSLDTYCCIDALIKFGIEGKRIILVEPPVEYEVLLTSCALQMHDVHVQSLFLFRRRLASTTATWRRWWHSR